MGPQAGLTLKELAQKEPKVVVIERGHPEEVPSVPERFIIHVHESAEVSVLRKIEIFSSASMRLY